MVGTDFSEWNGFRATERISFQQIGHFGTISKGTHLTLLNWFDFKHHLFSKFQKKLIWQWNSGGFPFWYWPHASVGGKGQSVSWSVWLFVSPTSLHTRSTRPDHIKNQTRSYETKTRIYETTTNITRPEQTNQINSTRLNETHARPGIVPTGKRKTETFDLTTVFGVMWRLSPYSQTDKTNSTRQTSQLTIYEGIHATV